MKKAEDKLNLSQQSSPKRPKHTGAERMRKLRARRKETGYKAITAFIPDEYKKLLDQFCSTTGLTIPNFICYMLGCVHEGKTVKVDKPITFNP